jgi:hypothetical protein
MIFEATKRKWSEVFDYPNYESFLDALVEMNIIELLENSRFRLLNNITLRTLNDL